VVVPGHRAAPTVLVGELASQMGWRGGRSHRFRTYFRAECPRTLDSPKAHPSTPRTRVERADRISALVPLSHSPLSQRPRTLAWLRLHSPKACLAGVESRVECQKEGVPSVAGRVGVRVLVEVYSNVTPDCGVHSHLTIGLLRVSAKAYEGGGSTAIAGNQGLVSDTGTTREKERIA
jgi:hypothetical protein